MKNYFKSLFGVAALFLFTLSAVAQAPLQYRVDTIQGLLNVTLYGADAKVTAWVGGATARDDGDGGVFFYDGNSAVSTNVYAVYKPLNNAGRWWKLPTSVAYQTTAVTVGTDTTYAWKLLRNGQTNFFGIGADNTTAYLQTFNGKTLQINNLGNNTILNATAGNVGIGTTAPTAKLEVSGDIYLSTGAARNITIPNAAAGGTGVDLTVRAQSGVSGNSAGGVLYLLGGHSSGATVNGSVDIRAGETQTVGSATTGGSVNFRTGLPSNTLTTGDITFQGYTVATPPVLSTWVTVKGATGNVGIGTTAPTSLLSVNGAAGLSSLVVTNGATLGSLTVTNNLIVGDAPAGNAIRAIYSAAAQLDFPSVTANSVTNLTITVTGAGTNSTVVVSSANGTVATADGLSFSAYVSATNTVTVRAANGTLNAWDPASSSYRATVFQY